MMYALVFLSTAVADVVWARYTLAVTAKATWQAATWSALIIVLGGFNVTQYVHDWRNIIPAAAGAFAGTWLAVRK